MPICVRAGGAQSPTEGAVPVGWGLTVPVLGLKTVGQSPKAALCQAGFELTGEWGTKITRCFEGSHAPQDPGEGLHKQPHKPLGGPVCEEPQDSQLELVHR